MESGHELDEIGQVQIETSRRGANVRHEEGSQHGPQKRWLERDICQCPEWDHLQIHLVLPPQILECGDLMVNEKQGQKQ